VGAARIDVLIEEGAPSRLVHKRRGIPEGTVSDVWATYFEKLNNKAASIVVDTGLAANVPIPSKPWLLWVWLYFKMPRADGLSDSDEAPTLWAVEDALVPGLKQTCGAIMCGRITTDGHREFFFYGESSQGFEDAVKQTMAGFPGYRFRGGITQDAQWEHYRQGLFPSPKQQQLIANQDILASMEKQGDVLSVPREVDHWAYFPSDAERSAFRKAAESAGFVTSSEDRVERDLSFELVFRRTQTIKQPEIDETVLTLFRLAQLFNGDYDGWGAPVTKQ